MVHPYEEQRKNFKDSKVFKSFLNCPKIQTPTTNTNNKYDKKNFFQRKKKKQNIKKKAQQEVPGCNAVKMRSHVFILYCVLSLCIIISLYALLFDTKVLVT